MPTQAPARRLAFQLARAAASLTFQAAPAAAVLVLVIPAVAGLGPGAAAYAIRLLLDELAQGSHAGTGRVVLFAVAATLFGAVSLVASYLAGYVSGYVQQAVLAQAEDRLYAHVNSFAGLRHVEDPHFHDQMRLAERAVEMAPADLTVFVVNLIRQGASAAAFVGLLLAIWPPMTGLLVLAAVPALIAQLMLTRQAARAEVAMASWQRKRHYFQELLMDPGAAKEIRLFGLGTLFHTRMMSALHQSNRLEDQQNRRATLRELLLAALNTVVALTGTVVVVLAAVHGRLSIGDVTLFFAAIASTQGAFAVVIPGFGRAHRSLRIFSAYLDVIEEPPDFPDGTGAVPELRHGVELRDVWFRYNDSLPWVLRGVNLTIPAGRSAGLVGANGAGKSTLVKLLLRMYDPDRGSITWAGASLTELRVAELRQHVRVTSQDFVAFDLPAGENIGLGDVDHLDDRGRIETAARLAGVGPVLERLPAGYDTLLSRAHTDELGRSGTTLSGGEWQKVAIARALMRGEASLLVLDEPSSGLDAQAEHQIHQILAGHQPYTKLLISHRLNAIKDAEIIYVLSDGQIAEQGTHQELMRAGGEYARLFRLQAAGYQDTAPTATGS